MNRLEKNRLLPMKREAGIVLVGTMLVLMVILTLTLIGFAKNSTPDGKPGIAGMAASSANSTRSARTRMAFIYAENNAETGIRATLQWLNGLGGPPTYLQAFAPGEMTAYAAPYWSHATTTSGYSVVNFPDLTYVAGTPVSRYKVRIYPYSGNDTSLLRSFIIESVGEYDDKTQIVRASVTQDTFARYAFFSDSVPAGWWVAGNTAFNGPVHINNTANASMDIDWSDSGDATKQIFRWDGDGAFTTSSPSSSVNWHLNGSDDITVPTTDADWEKVVAGGRDHVKYGVPEVTMPTNSDTQRDAALGGEDQSAYSTEGVHVPNSGSVPTGGVYIKGDVDDMVLRASGTGNRDQIIDVYQTQSGAKVKYTVTMSQTGTTTVQKYTYNSGTGLYVVAGSATSYTGETNGVLYVEGNVGGQGDPKVGGVSGTIANSVTSGSTVTKPFKLNIVTNGDDDLNIDGNIRYANTAGDALVAAFGAGTLGIVSHHVQVVNSAEVVESTVNGDTYDDDEALTTVAVHATVMAYDTFDATDPTTRAVGTFNLLGGYIAKTGGRFGQYSIDGTMFSGFQRIMNYDQRAANQPPPYFPGSGSNYVLTSYQRVSATIQ